VDVDFVGLEARGPTASGYVKLADGGATRLRLDRFFDRAITSTNVTPTEIVTDRAAVYPKVLDEVAPAAWHRTEQYANNRIDADHRRRKRRLRPG
jgi:hypothetical protein